MNPSENMTLVESFGCRSCQRNLATGPVGAGLPALQGIPYVHGEEGNRFSGELMHVPSARAFPGRPSRIPL